MEVKKEKLGKKQVGVVHAITILLLVFQGNIFQLCAQKMPFEIHRKALDVGVYDYSKAKKNSYKIYYDEEAAKKFDERLMSDERLRTVGDFGQYIEQEDGSTVYSKEQWAYEYCPELEYVLITGGHGFVSAFDLRTLEEIYTNPSTHIYSPSRKYRFGSFHYDGVRYYIEVKEGEKYVPYLLLDENEGAMTGVYWEDDETIHYLREVKRLDGSIYWIGYAMEFKKITQ